MSSGAIAGAVVASILIDEEEETEESSLWKVKKGDWETVERNILQDLEDRGYKNPYLDEDLDVMYERDSSFDFGVATFTAIPLWLLFGLIIGLQDPFLRAISFEQISVVAVV